MKTTFSISIAVAILSLAISLSAAHASEHIKIVKCDGSPNWKECATISISGDITESDGMEFIERTKEIKNADVILESLGGSFTSGLIIGQQVFVKKFQTRVLDHVLCVSSCANIWLAGRLRSAGVGSVVVFHSPYKLSDPTHADGMAAVMEGIYLARLGLSYKAAMELFGGHGPENVRAYVVDGEGVQHGISCDVDAHGSPKSCAP